MKIIHSITYMPYQNQLESEDNHTRVFLNEIKVPPFTLLC